MTCTITHCICRTRRNPGALPAAAHRSTLTAQDHAYRAALGAPGGLPASIGTIAHGGTESARRRAVRSRRSSAPRFL